MKHNERVLELHPHLSKLIDALTFELAVNMPDENSLSLLEILQMRRDQQISLEELRQLYRSWLEAKNVFDLFSAKQVRVFSKSELLADPKVAPLLIPNTINSCLQMLNDLYDHLCATRKPHSHLLLLNKETEDLFSFLDHQGVIHLRTSQLFFLAAALLVYEGQSLPTTYQQFKPHFKAKNRDLCQVEGMVCLRCFKNYFLFRQGADTARTVTDILRDIQLVLRIGEGRAGKDSQHHLPNILEEAFQRWGKSGRFATSAELRKKKIESFRRIFEENESLFLMHGGRDEPALSEHYFQRKYGEDYIRSMGIDTQLLRQFGTIVEELLGEYLGIVIRMSHGYTGRHQKSQASSMSGIQGGSGIYGTPSHHASTAQPGRSQAHLSSSVQLGHNNYRKPAKNQPRQLGQRERTPTKATKIDSKRQHVTPNSKRTNISPFMQRQFGSVDKSASKRKAVTPTKSHIGAYSSGAILPLGTTYRHSKKEGLEKDSFYQKLFFFRNKRVESFDIVMRRLKGK